MTTPALLIGIGVLMTVDQIAKAIGISTHHQPHLPLIISTIVVIIGWYMLYKEKYSRLTRSGIAAIVAGGMSNGIDHIALGSIRDNIHIAGLDFNIADCSVVTGSALIVASMVASASRNNSAA